MEQNKSKSISLLLGAGFSKPMGFPLAKDLNNKLVNFDKFFNAIAPNGEIITTTEDNPAWYNYKPLFDFCKLFIKRYKEVNNAFNYEVFFDVIVNECINHNHFHLYKDIFDYQLYLGSIEMIFTQLIESFIHDEDGKTWYDRFPPNRDKYEKYKTFTKIIKTWCKTNVVNVHTLNHDLLFEEFNRNYLSGLVSDGFSKAESPYYGNVQRHQIRLEKYEGKYDTSIRLFKLHGSLDYVVYRNQYGNFEPESYVKIPYIVRKEDLVKKNVDGSKKYFEFAYHADFLTGQESKIKRYGEPIFYGKLFKHFKQNLQSAEKLIIIGYSGGDTAINKMISENFDFKNKKSYLIDPYPNENFAKAINAKIISKSIESVTLNDVE